MIMRGFKSKLRPSSSMRLAARLLLVLGTIIPNVAAADDPQVNYRSAAAIDHGLSVVAFRGDSAAAIALQSPAPVFHDLARQEPCQLLALDADGGATLLHRGREGFLTTDAAASASAEVLCIAYGKMARASWNEGGFVELFATETGCRLRSVCLKGARPSCVAIAPSGALFAFGVNETVCIANPASADGDIHVCPTAGTVTSLAFTPDGQRVAIGCSLGSIQIIDSSTGNRAAWLNATRGTIEPIVFAHDGARLAAITDDGSVHIWDSRTGELQRTISTVAYPYTIAFVPRTDYLAILGGERRLSVIDPTTGDEVHSMALGGHSRLSFSTDGTYMASCDDDGAVIVHGIDRFGLD